MPERPAAAGQRESEDRRIGRGKDASAAKSQAGIDGVRALAARLFAVREARVRLVGDGGACSAEDAADRAFCDHALRASDVLVIADAATDARFADVPAVRAGRIRFFAGAPLVDADGTRLGTLSVAGREPRPDIGAEQGRMLAELARLAVDAIGLGAAERRLAVERAARRLAEARLKLANDLTRAALAAPDFKAAMTVCLRRMAEHVGADCAFARGQSPHSGRLEIVAHYVAPGAPRELLGIRDHFRRFPVARDNSVVAATIFEQRLQVLPDLAAIDPQRFPLVGVARAHGVNSMFAVPCENAGTRYALTFLFRQTPTDLAVRAETVGMLTGPVRDLLARKEAEDRIALLQSVVVHTGDAVMIAETGPNPGDPARVVYVNPAFTVLTGHAAEDVIGRPPTMLYGRASETEALAQLREAAARVEPCSTEMHVHRTDGSAFWAEIEITPLADADGWYSYWIAVLRDRTERRAAEIARRGSETALRLLAERQTAVLDALPAHVALLDGEGHLVSASRSWSAFAHELGASANPVGASYFEFLQESCAPEHADVVMQGVLALLAGRQAQFSTDYACDKGGRRRWYRLMLAPMASAAASGAVAMHLDVTSSKLAEDALRREKDFSEFLIKSATEGILVFDHTCRITLWNPGIEAITGMTNDEVLGRNAFDVLPFLAGTVGERAMRGVLEGKEASYFDQRYAIPTTGRGGFYEAYFSPLYGRRREVIGGIGFLRETTERRRIEDALRQSQKMEAVGQLTGGIAHDFNNMLTVIAGNLELLEGKLAHDPRLVRLVNSAALAASRAEKLTQQLLTFSRRQQLRPQAVDFNQIVIGMNDLLHRTVGENIDIRTQLAPELWAALADPNQLETALLNLVLNARDAMPVGGRITLETANADIGRGDAELAPGSYATLAVSDIGHGMGEQVLAHVFEPFFTTKEVGKGTGLGLSQVYGFISQSAGHVKIDSREGEGTTVRLFLPRAESATDAGDKAPMREKPYRGSETVLVVEDDHGVRDFAASVLRELGYRVLEASSGELALELLDAHAGIELLFTDVVMPGPLNGADLARIARGRRSELRLLFTSGYTTRILEKEWPTEEVEFLRKPYRSIDLAQRVRAILDRAKQAV
jgi:PAS domain S-box-containing protein